MAVAAPHEVAAVLERQLGMTVHEVRRQVRWRPTWFVSGERDGARFDVVVRGDRVDALGFPLRHEFAFHTLLEEHGIPVPHLYGWCDELDAMLMEFVPGRPDFAGVDDTDRDRIVDEYLQAMVAVHQLPVEPFVAAGITRAADGSGMVSMRIQEAQWRAAKEWPDPFMEFCLQWMHRLEPDSAGRAQPILCDTGQFHHDGHHLVTLLDLEGGHIADPMMDLAVWRMRDTLIPFGDMRQLYARYEELSGTEIDLEAVKRYSFASTIGNELMFGAAVHRPTDDTDLMTYVQWNSDTNLMATECKTVQLKLRRQGSKFAESEAFRIYRFRDGAWPEIILGAVMGAARRAEAAVERQRIEDSLRAPMEPTFGPMPMRAEPVASPSTAPPRPRTSRKGPDAKFVAQFGIHARHAEAELARADAAFGEETEEPANNNTAPPPRPSRQSAEAKAPASFAPPPKAESATFDATKVEPSRESIDVVLKRETATVSLPRDVVSKNDNDAGLIGRIGEALSLIEKNERVSPITNHDEARPSTSNADVLVLLPSTEKDELFEDVEIDVDSDPAHADAASIAGRLRPRFAGE